MRRPDSLPFPHMAAGTESMHQIKHVVVLMMENHSFDNMYGRIPQVVKGRARVDGLTMSGGHITNSNPDKDGKPVFARHASTPCQPEGEPTQTWNASHEAYAHGKNTGFVKASSPFAMRYVDDRDIPFTYSLVKHFPIGQRYFCSVLAQTYPNRRFLFTGTASGLISTDLAESLKLPAKNGTIWDRLDAHDIPYAVYYQNLPSWAIVPGTRCARTGSSSLSSSTPTPPPPDGSRRSPSWIPSTRRPRRRIRRTFRSARTSCPGSSTP